MIVLLSYFFFYFQKPNIPHDKALDDSCKKKAAFEKGETLVLGGQSFTKLVRERECEKQKMGYNGEDYIGTKIS